MFRVVTDFMLFCLAKADDVWLMASRCVGHVHDDVVKPTEQIDSLLAVSFAAIFPLEDRAIEDRFTTIEVQSVALMLRRRFGSSQVGML